MPNFGCEQIPWGMLTRSDSNIAGDPPVLVGEASSIGWPPGKWPVYVTVDVEVPGMESRRAHLFGPRQAIVYHGDLVGYKYPQVNQELNPVYEVHLLND